MVVGGGGGQVEQVEGLFLPSSSIKLPEAASPTPAADSSTYNPTNKIPATTPAPIQTTTTSQPIMSLHCES